MSPINLKPREVGSSRYEDGFVVVVYAVLWVEDVAAGEDFPVISSFFGVVQFGCVIYWTVGLNKHQNGFKVRDLLR